MPKVQIPRSLITGEILSAETLEIAAVDHGIDLATTSVGRMFDNGAEKLAAKKRLAFIERKAEFQVGDRVKVRDTGDEGTVDEVGEQDVEEGYEGDKTYISVVGDDGVQLGGYTKSELVKVASIHRKAGAEIGDTVVFNNEGEEETGKVKDTSEDGTLTVDVGGFETFVLPSEVKQVKLPSEAAVKSYAEARRAKAQLKRKAHDQGDWADLRRGFKSYLKEKGMTKDNWDAISESEARDYVNWYNELREQTD